MTWRYSFSVLAATVTALALPGVVVSQAPARAGAGSAVERLSDSLVQQLITPRLGPYERLVSPVFAGPFGPAPRAILALTARSPEDPDPERRLRFTGFALIDSAGTWLQVALPPLTDAWAGEELLAVLFQNLDADPALEIIVIATYIPAVGPQAAVVFFYNSVLDWDGARYVRLADVERRIEGLRTAAAVRRALRSRPRN